MKRFLKENGLSIAMFGLFFLFLAGHVLSGSRAYNQEQLEHGLRTATLGEYLITGHFWESLFENWESEFLQMALYVILTACLFQKGSAESKKPDGEEVCDEDPAAHAGDPGAPGPVRRGGLALRIYKHSLSLALLALFFASWSLHAFYGARNHLAEELAHGAPPPSIGEYLRSSRFWFESFQNWQSEFLSVGVLIVLSIFLRQVGSPGSKPVHMPHSHTGKD